MLFHFLFRLVYNIAKPDFDYIELEDKFYNLTFKDKLVYSLEKNYDKLKQSLVLLGVAVILMAIAGVIEVNLKNVYLLMNLKLFHSTKVELHFANATNWGMN